MKQRLISFPVFTILLFIIFTEYLLDIFAYRYAYFATASLNLSSLIISLFCIVLLLYAISLRRYSFMEYIMFDTLFFIASVPNIILYVYDILDIRIVLATVLWNLVPTLKKVHIPKLNLDFHKTMRVVIVLSIFLSAFVLFKNRELLSFSHLNLSEDTYQTRSNYSSDNKGIVMYFSTWLSKFIIPSIIIYFGLKKNFLVLALFTVLGLSMFFVNPHKSALFITIISVILSFVKMENQYLKFVNMGFVALGVIPFLIFQDFFISTIIRRTFFVPAYLNGVYFDIFNDLKLFLSYSSINPFMENVVGMSPASYVSIKHFHFSGHSNNGIISSGYMNFGYLGVLLNLTSFYFLTSQLTKSKNRIINYMTLPMIFTFLSSPFIQTLTTHGMVYVVFLASLKVTNIKLK